MAIIHFVDGTPYDNWQVLEAPPVSAHLREASPGVVEKKRTAFTSIGINRPLTVEIRHIYLGEVLPDKRWWRNTSMLVTSAMKSVGQYNAEPRAINVLSKEIGESRHVKMGDATVDGTQIVYYSPALTRPASVLTVEVGFDDFDGALFDSVGDFVQAAGKLPIFIAWGGYLLGVGSVVKLASRILERIFERPPALKVHESISFVTPGGVVPMEGFKVLGDDNLVNLLQKGRFAPDNDGVLVDANGKKYAESIPYITISLDGAERSDLTNFEPTQASAAILGDIFGVRDNQRADLTLIMDGLKLANDLKFRREADQVRSEILKIGNDPLREKQSADLQEKLDALVKNISQQELRP